MTTIQFISYNLKPGDKVRIKLAFSSIDEETKEIVAYFKGLRTMYGQHIADIDYLYPVFCKETKDGKMSRQHTFEYTSLGNIISIENLNEKSFYSQEEIQGIINTSHNVEANCKKQVINILKELDSLFPGKWLGLESYTFNAAFWEEHGGIATGINARPLRIRYENKDGKDGFVIEVDCDTYTTSVHSNENSMEYRQTDLLYSVVNAIMMPYEAFDDTDEDEIEKHIDLVGLGHENIPSATAKQPVLLEMKLLETARANLWWYSDITPKQRSEIFKGKVAPEKLHEKWTNTPDSIKGYIYASWMYEHKGGKAEK